MLHFDDFCRLCAQKKRNKFNLFTPQNNEEASILLAKIAICLSLQVTREDILPKMVCYDCQKSVESFDMFRIKCHKAEERLLKMVLITNPNKTTVTNIKQELLETDCHDDYNCQLEINPLALYDSLSLPAGKTVKNVKSEIDDENEIFPNSNIDIPSSDLIQILSKEVVNQQALEDVKQPTIEVVSENFNEKCKIIDVVEVDNNDSSEIKVIPDALIRDYTQNQGFEDNIADNAELLPINFVEIKVPVQEIDEKVGAGECMEKEISSGPVILSSVATKQTNRANRKKKCFALDESLSQSEMEERFVTLTEGEECNVDIEEIEAMIKKKQDPAMRFQCDKCSRSFKFFKSLRKHSHRHDSLPEIFICNICKKKNSSSYEFSSQKSLGSHIQRKHTPSNKARVKCELCYKVVLSKGQLNAHLKRVHNNAEASCQTCGKKFKNKIRLHCHQVVHNEERPYVCDQCGRSFKWSNALKVHIQSHGQEKNYLCSDCGKKFTAKKNLLEHLNIHNGKRPFICEKCDATFVQLSAYSKHIYLHNEGSGAHKCDQCQKSYSRAYLLKQHLLRHSSVRPFECLTCHCKFKSQSDLWCHSKIHQEKRYGCQICGRKFALSKTLKDHMVLHTGIKHVCPAPGCGKTYTQRFSLTKHFSKQHPSLSIVNRKGGRKSHLSEKDFNNVDFIRYQYKERK